MRGRAGGLRSGADPSTHWLPDLLVAAVFAVVAETEMRLSSTNVLAGSVPVSEDTWLVLLPLVPVVWRRRAPLAALAAMTALIVVTGFLLGGTICFFGGLLPFLVLLFSASGWAPRPYDRWALLMPAVIVASLLIASPPNFILPNDLVFSTVVMGSAWAAGQSVRRWRRLSDDLAAALDELESGRDVAARLAASEERARIARELHDVVAHSMSVMVMQAGVGRLDLATDPGMTDRALRTIEETGRGAMHEMRRLLGVLRSGDEAALQPQPGLSSLPGLVESMRDSGLQLETEVVVPRDLPTAIDVNAYRIVQELLTNALRHGRGRATLTMAAADGDLRIRVSNPVGTGAHRGSGHGLVGVRERVALFDGVIDARSQAGVFAVEVFLPLPVGVRETTP